MTRFTKEEDQFIKDNYLTMPCKAIAAALNRSGYGTRNRYKILGLKVPKYVTEKFKSDSQFKAGQTSFNKGLKQHDFMSPDAIERTKATRFQKGNLPHNTKQDFELSIRKDNRGEKQVFIRVSLGKWIHLSRYLWTQVYGKIPRGHNIQFKDGDTMNVVIDNLYMVNRKQQVRHNQHGGRKLPNDLKQTIDYIYQLKSKIYEKQDNRPK